MQTNPLPRITTWHTNSNYRLLYPIYAVLTGMLSLVYPTIGALIVSRLPRNPIGWIFCGVGLLYQLQHVALAYSNYAVAEGGSLPWGEYAAWFSAWVGFAGLTLSGGFLLLLFRRQAWRMVVGSRARLPSRVYHGAGRVGQHLEGSDRMEPQ